MIRILMLSLLAVAAIQCATVCEPNPCNKGVCTVFNPENSKHLPYATCKCDAGYAGARCELADQCAVKNPCTEGKLCSLDNVFKPVCACPLGFNGKDCKERLCTIKLFASKAIVGKTYIDNDMVKSLEGLEDLAKKCNVTVGVSQSFTRSLKPEHDVPENETSLYIGRGIAFVLNDSQGKKPASTLDSNCFLKGVSGLNLVHNKNVLQDKEYDSASKEYSTLKTAAQVGCALNNELPQVAPSRLVGKWEIVEDKNWEDFLKANEVGWFKRMALKVIKPDMEITNDGKDWVVLMTSSFKNVEHAFTENVEMWSLSPISGSKTKHMFTTKGKDYLEENSIIYADSGERKVRITREMVGDRLVQTMYVKDVVCVRTYGRKA